MDSKAEYSAGPEAGELPGPVTPETTRPLMLVIVLEAVFAVAVAVWFFW